MCKLCDKIWDALSAESNAWEREASNLNELLSQESDQTWKLIERAFAMQGTDPASAIKLYLEAADAGSVWSLGTIGWYYWKGVGVANDPLVALGYYRRAISVGSSMDIIYYARILAQLGRDEDCERALQNGVKLDFVPSYYWLAWFRYKRFKTSAKRREVRPLLEYAAKKGHPGAKILLVRWMMLGKLGFRDMPRGWRLAFQGGVSLAFRKETACPS